MLGKKQFENMSLYTLANLYIDTFSDYSTRQIHDNDLSLNTRILDYIVHDRKDENIFFNMIDSMYRIRKGFLP